MAACDKQCRHLSRSRENFIDVNKKKIAQQIAIKKT